MHVETADLLLLVSLHLKLTEGSCVSLDGLGDVPLHTVELHGPHHSVVLSTDADEEEPRVGLVSPVVDYLDKSVSTSKVSTP